MEYEEDIEKIKQFVLDVKKDIGFVVTYIGGIAPRLRQGGLIDILQVAWEEVIPKFDRIIKYLDKKPVEQLEDNGLVGAQLALKLKLYYQDRRKLEDAKEEYKILQGPLQGPIEAERRLRTRIDKRLCKCLHPVLRDAATIFGSLDFIPGAHAITEFKDIINNHTP